MGVADKYDALLKEMPKVRADLGYPPLVTPSSQIVGSMATMNVVLGRYKMIPKEVRDIVRGKYGRTPGPISEELKKLVLKMVNSPLPIVRPMISHRKWIRCALTLPQKAIPMLAWKTS